MKIRKTNLDTYTIVFLVGGFAGITAAAIGSWWSVLINIPVYAAGAHYFTKPAQGEGKEGG